MQDFFHQQYYAPKERASNKPHEGVIFRIEIIHLEICNFLTAIHCHSCISIILNNPYLDSKQSKLKSQVPFSNILYSSMTPTFLWDATVSGRAWTMYNLPSSPSRAHSMSCNGSRNGEDSPHPHQTKTTEITVCMELFPLVLLKKQMLFTTCYPVIKKTALSMFSTKKTLQKTLDPPPTQQPSTRTTIHQKGAPWADHSVFQSSRPSQPNLSLP